MQKVDLSPQAITVRLKRIEQLRRLCLSLGKTTFPGSKDKEPKKSVARLKERGEANSK